MAAPFACLHVVPGARAPSGVESSDYGGSDGGPNGPAGLEINLDTRNPLARGECLNRGQESPGTMGVGGDHTALGERGDDAQDLRFVRIERSWLSCEKPP